jgi:hypothetical protein
MDSTAKHPINNLISQYKGITDITFCNNDGLHCKTDTKTTLNITFMVLLMHKIISSFIYNDSYRPFIQITIKPLLFNMLLQFLLFNSPVSI